MLRKTHHGGWRGLLKMLPPTAYRGACLLEQDLASSAWSNHLSSHPVHDLVSRSSQPLTVTAGRKLIVSCIYACPLPSLGDLHPRCDPSAGPESHPCLVRPLNVNDSAAREPSKAAPFLAFSAGWEKSSKEAQLISALFMQNRRYLHVTAHRCKMFTRYA